MIWKSRLFQVLLTQGDYMFRNGDYPKHVKCSRCRDICGSQYYYSGNVIEGEWWVDNYYGYVFCENCLTIRFIIYFRLWRFYNRFLEWLYWNF